MKKKIFISSFLCLFGFSLILPSINKYPEIEKDNVIYEQSKVVDYDKPLFETRKNATINYPKSITLHYVNEDAKCDNRAFYFWFTGVNGKEYEPDEVSSDKKSMTITLDFTSTYSKFANKKMYMIVKYKMKGTDENWNGKSDDTPLDFETYPPKEDGSLELWIVPGVGTSLEIYTSEEDTKMDKALSARFISWKEVEVLSTIAPSNYQIYAFTSNYLRLNEAMQESNKSNFLLSSGQVSSYEKATFNGQDCVKWIIKLNLTIHINVQYQLVTTYPSKVGFETYRNISVDSLYSDERFNKFYNYTGNDLGVTYSPLKTTFKVWAPSTSRMFLMLYNSYLPSTFEGGDDSYRAYEMYYAPGGVWEVTITNKDLHGVYYNFTVFNSLGRNITTDPYAKACGINGERGMVVDFSRTNPKNWDDIPLTWDNIDKFDISFPNELSIYETHIQDLTLDSSWNGKNKKGTYNAFVESGTTVSVDNITTSTGFDHLVDLGVKAIQIEPTFDYDNAEDDEHMGYNWGYNPKNYNCLEGGYSSNPFDGTVRINEFKNLVKAFANNSDPIRIIMDVVYNHVSSAPSSCFNLIMPGYYFRLDENSNYYDGSWCGNEFKSEAVMARKYIVESLCFWASEYKVKGFRFDLAGLIDVTTMNEVRSALYNIDPDIYIYGEGWTGDGSGYDWSSGKIYPVHGTSGEENYGCVSASAYQLLYPVEGKVYYGTFNDAGRNAIKGENNLDNGWGFISQPSEYVGNKSSIVTDMIIGYHTGIGGNPNQAINYASCHDNYTLFDQMCYTVGENGKNSYYPGIACAAVVAINSTIMFSNGVAFIHGGEELFRTKEVSKEDLELYGEKDTSIIDGKIISHNSYRLSGFTNAYKWERKVKIDDLKTLDYVEELIKAIKLRNKLKKYSYSDLKKTNPYSSDSEFNCWNNKEGSTCVAVKNQDYFLFVAGRNDNNISFGAYEDGYNKQAFCSNPKSGGFSSPVSGYIKLGWATAVCLTNR